MSTLPAVEIATVVRFICSDGREWKDKEQADVHQAEINLRAVCDRHGYSGSTSRSALFSVLRENTGDFRDALDALAEADKRLRESSG